MAPVEFRPLACRANNHRPRTRREAAAEAALGLLEEGSLVTVSSLTLLDQAFGIANTFDRTVYDSLYVALALESKGELITADEKLANALAARLPVKWLGAI
jgi:predicted nucleic acid-binding protein